MDPEFALLFCEEPRLLSDKAPELSIWSDETESDSWLEFSDDAPWLISFEFSDELFVLNFESWLLEMLL